MRGSDAHGRHRLAGPVGHPGHSDVGGPEYLLILVLKLPDSLVLYTCVIYGISLV